VRMSGSFLRFEDGSKAELELLARMSNKKESSAKKVNYLALIPRAFKDFFAVLTADQAKTETGTCVHAPHTVFPRENRRSIAVSTMPFQPVKDIKESLGVTVGDVILTGFCGAIRRYLEHFKDPSLASPEGPLMRSFCAVSMPDMKDRLSGPDSIYNKFVMPSLTLSMKKDRKDRLEDTVATMNKVKTSLEGPLTLMLTSVMGQLGLEEFAGKTSEKVFANHSFVYSSVPAFEKPVLAFGQKCSGLQGFYANIVTQTIFMTYNGNLTFSLMTDKSIVKDPQLLVDLFVTEMNDWHASVETRKKK